MESKIAENIKMSGQLEVIIRDAKTGKIKSHDVIKNMIVQAGKNGMAQGLSGQSGYGVITYCALGTSAVAPMISDTQLGAELVRKAISVRSFNNNQAIFQTLFNISEGNGHLFEAGLFGDLASLTPNSATLYAHAAIDRVKTSADTLTLVWTITIG